MLIFFTGSIFFEKSQRFRLLRRQVRDCKVHLPVIGKPQRFGLLRHLTMLATFAKNIQENHNGSDCCVVRVRWLAIRAFLVRSKKSCNITTVRIVALASSRSRSSPPSNWKITTVQIVAASASAADFILNVLKYFIPKKMSEL